MGRSARTDGTGSDHGGRSSNVTLLSGKFNKPLILGDTITEHPIKIYIVWLCR